MNTIDLTWMAVVVLMMVSSLPCAPTERRARSTRFSWWPDNLEEACSTRIYNASNTDCRLNDINVNKATSAVSDLKSYVKNTGTKCEGRLMTLDKYEIVITPNMTSHESMGEWYPKLVYLTALLKNIMANASTMLGVAIPEDISSKAYDSVNDIVCDIQCITRYPSFKQPDKIIVSPIQPNEIAYAKTLTCLVVKNLTSLLDAIQPSPGDETEHYNRESK